MAGLGVSVEENDRAALSAYEVGSLTPLTLAKRSVKPVVEATLPRGLDTVFLLSSSARRGPRDDQPNVNAKAFTAASRNSISNLRPAIGADCLIS